MVDEPPRQDLIERTKVKSGRVYMPKFVQSFEVCTKFILWSCVCVAFFMNNIIL